MRGRTSVAMTLLLTMIFAVILPGCLESFGSNTSPTATFSVQESGTLKAGMLLHFDATGTTDAEGDALTYSWDFGDSNTGSGLTASHTYNAPGDFTVVLSVGDGEFESQAEKTLKIYSEDAVTPTSEITTWKDSDCDDEDPPASGTYILVWVCDDMEESERDWDPSTTVSLDGSGSAAGSTESWLVSWKWDININIDSDGDGEKDNDVDADGETYEWATVPGEWKVRLTVTDDQGMQGTYDTWVYVNGRAKWSNLEIGRNNSADNPRQEFTAPITYDFDNSHKLNQFKSRLVYPKKDPGVGCGAACEQPNRMDLYFFNDTSEEVRNSSANSDEQRTDSNCADDNYCLIMTASTGDLRTYLDGTWTVQVLNEKQHNAEILEVQIILKYK